MIWNLIKFFLVLITLSFVGAMMSEVFVRGSGDGVFFVGLLITAICGFFLWLLFKLFGRR